VEYLWRGRELDPRSDDEAKGAEARLNAGYDGLEIQRQTMQYPQHNLVLCINQKDDPAKRQGSRWMPLHLGINLRSLEYIPSCFSKDIVEWVENLGFERHDLRDGLTSIVIGPDVRFDQPLSVPVKTHRGQSQSKE
jgi:hypothetical protein